MQQLLELNKLVSVVNCLNLTQACRNVQMMIVTDQLLSDSAQPILRILQKL